MNNESSSCGCSGCLSTIIFIILICFCVSFCARQDKSKGFIDNSIEAMHRWTNYVDSVWHNSEEIKPDTTVITTSFHNSIENNIDSI